MITSITTTSHVLQSARVSDPYILIPILYWMAHVLFFGHGGVDDRRKASRPRHLFDMTKLLSIPIDMGIREHD